RIVEDDSTAEGGTLTHRVELVDVDGNLIEVVEGEAITVTLAYNNEGITANPDGSADYTPTTSVTIPAGQSSVLINNPTLDDRFSEAPESYTLSITDVSQSNDSYEAVAITSDVEDQSVIGTITSNTDTNNETEGGYNSNDTVLVQITGNDSAIEGDGDSLTHTITLVDNAGNPVELYEGQSIEVTLSYTNDDTVDADYEGERIAETITISGTAAGVSTIDISQAVADDILGEGQETYTLSIASVSDTGSVHLENLAIDTDNQSV
ncbi:hypothetical protein CXF56_13980, partial [Psychrobacter sp. Choline-02u-13]